MTPSGGLNLSSTLAFAIAASGNVLTAYTVPVQPSHSQSYSSGTGAGQVQKGATAGGTASATPASIDLSSITCLDNTTGLSHLRELVIFNDDTANDLLLDGTATNAFIAFLSTAAKVTIPAGSYVRFFKPKGTNGWTVDSTHKILSLDPGANNIAYRVIALGD